MSPWLVIEYYNLLVTVAGSNGGGDHPIPAVVRRYCCYWCGRHCSLSPLVNYTVSSVPTHNKIVLLTSMLFCISLLLWLAGLLMSFGQYVILLNLFRSPLFWPAYCTFYNDHWMRLYYTEYRAAVISHIVINNIRNSHASLHNRSDNWCHFRWA